MPNDLKDEKQSLSSTLNIYDAIKKTIVVGKGVGVGVFWRFTLWPFEKVYLDKSNPKNTYSYLQLYKKNLNPQQYARLCVAFARTGFWQTVFKSISNTGVIIYTDAYNSGMTPFQKGVFIAKWGTLFEALTTARGEARKVQTFNQDNANDAKAALKNDARAALKKEVKRLKERRSFRALIRAAIQSSAAPKMGFLTPEFARSFAATAMRVYPGNFTTFYSIYKTTDVLRPYAQRWGWSESQIKMAGAFVGAAAIQPPNMVMINLQTHILGKPDVPIRQSIIHFFSERPSLPDLLRGAIGRTIYRSKYYLGVFAMNEWVLGGADQKAEDEKRAAVSPKTP